MSYLQCLLDVIWFISNMAVIIVQIILVLVGFILSLASWCINECRYCKNKLKTVILAIGINLTYILVIASFVYLWLNFESDDWPIAHKYFQIEHKETQRKLEN